MTNFHKTLIKYEYLIKQDNNKDERQLCASSLFMSYYSMI